LNIVQTEEREKKRNNKFLIGFFLDISFLKNELTFTLVILFIFWSGSQVHFFIFQASGF